MNLYYSFKIYSTYLELPASWDSLATKNIFLSKQYFEILEKSAPTNMECHYIGLFHKEELIGIALSQFIDANQLISFGDRDKCIKTFIRNFFFKNFSSRVLFVGNNMLTGQNAINQIEEFKKITPISGIIMTKLDGTAKGGILVAIAKQFQIPIYAIGVGEKEEDLDNFIAKDFVQAFIKN